LHSWTNAIGLEAELLPREDLLFFHNAQSLARASPLRHVNLRLIGVNRLILFNLLTYQGLAFSLLRALSQHNRYCSNKASIRFATNALRITKLLISSQIVPKDVV